MKAMSSKRWLISTFLIVTIAALPVAYAIWPFEPAPTVFGPVNCDACQLQARIPDEATKTFLNTYRAATNAQRRGSFEYSIQAGSKVIVCNASHCATYELTDSYDWNGTDQEPITRPPSRGGGGGGGSGGSGGGRGGSNRGANPGAGCYGSCGGRSGSVSVRKPMPVVIKPI